MREAIGSSLLFNLVITFVIIMIAFLISSLAYSKAFKAKNRVIDIIEKYNGITDDAKTEINNNLNRMGYSFDRGKKCNDFGEDVLKSNYDICVIEKSTSEGPYYKVITYMSFDIPVIGNFLHFKVEGETKVLINTYINYEE